jgi:hypothetical protein
MTQPKDLQPKPTHPNHQNRRPQQPPPPATGSATGNGRKAQTRRTMIGHSAHMALRGQVADFAELARIHTEAVDQATDQAAEWLAAAFNGDLYYGTLEAKTNALLADYEPPSDADYSQIESPTLPTLNGSNREAIQAFLPSASSNSNGSAGSSPR